MAAAAPSSAWRHDSVVPTAITMVSASTISTAVARKTARTKMASELWTSMASTPHLSSSGSGPW